MFQNIVEGSWLWQKYLYSQELPLVQLAFAKTHLYLTWKLYSNTCKDEIESALQHLQVRKNTLLIEEIFTQALCNDEVDYVEGPMV